MNPDLLLFVMSIDLFSVIVVLSGVCTGVFVLAMVARCITHGPAGVFRRPGRALEAADSADWKLSVFETLTQVASKLFH